MILNIHNKQHEKFAKNWNKKQVKMNREFTMISLVEKTPVIKNRNMIDINKEFDFDDIDSDKELEYIHGMKYAKFSKP